MRETPPSSGAEPRLYRLIFEHFSEPIVVIDDDGRLLAANRAARELQGVDVERLFLWTPQRDPDIASLRAQLRVSGRGTTELRLGDPDKRVMALEGRAHGQAYVVVMRDVTERRRLEEELRQLRARQPARDDAAVPSSRRERDDDPPSGSETVLVIDSDDPVRGALREVLSELGYRVLDAPTGELGLRQAEAARAAIDLVLADLHAPGLRGHEVVARLRATGQSPRLLWMSGDTERAIAQQGLEGVALLRKAFSPDQLARKVRAILDADGGQEEPTPRPAAAR